MSNETDLVLAQLRDLLENAVPRPWLCKDYHVEHPHRGVICETVCDAHTSVLIAAAPDLGHTVLALVEKVKQLRGAIRCYRDAYIEAFDDGLAGSPESSILEVARDALFELADPPKDDNV